MSRISEEASIGNSSVENEPQIFNAMAGAGIQIMD